MCIVIDRIDHIVLTVADIDSTIDSTIDFCEKVLGMKAETFGDGRRALSFGKSKLNLHQRGKEFEPKAKHPIPGAIDLCLITESSLDAVIRHLNNLSISIEQGPVKRTGALGPIESVYIRDPDANLIEISNYLKPAPK